MRLFVYVVAHDAGFAPNPFWGYCTLATCKPAIRRVANEGDWVVGISPKRHGNKLVYAMQIKEKLSFDDYFNDKRFAKKKPDPIADDCYMRCGDNIYYRENKCRYKQLTNDFHGDTSIDTDTGPGYVLVSGKDDFYYFGKDAIEIPSDLLQKIVVLRAHRSKFDQSTIDKVLAFISSLTKGVHADPRDFKDKCPGGKNEGCAF